MHYFSGYFLNVRANIVMTSLPHMSPMVRRFDGYKQRRCSCYSVREKQRQLLTTWLLNGDCPVVILRPARVVMANSSERASDVVVSAGKIRNLKINNANNSVVRGISSTKRLHV